MDLSGLLHVGNQLSPPLLPSAWIAVDKRRRQMERTGIHGDNDNLVARLGLAVQRAEYGNLPGYAVDAEEALVFVFDQVTHSVERRRVGVVRFHPVDGDGHRQLAHLLHDVDDVGRMEEDGWVVVDVDRVEAHATVQLFVRHLQDTQSDRGVLRRAGAVHFGLEQRTVVVLVQHAHQHVQRTGTRRQSTVVGHHVQRVVGPALAVQRDRHGQQSVY